MQQALESAAPERLNPALPPEAITAGVDEVTYDLLSGQVALASVSANGASSSQPGATPQVSNHKHNKG